MYSFAVKALMSPPTRSTAEAMSRALRASVPLNSRCSRKWETPDSWSGSSRAPTPTHTPVATESAVGDALGDDPQPRRELRDVRVGLAGTF